MRLFNNNKPLLLALLFFILMVWGSIKYVSYKRGEWESDKRAQTLELLVAKKSSLEKALFSRIYYTRGVAAYVSQNPAITADEYNKLANEFIRNDSVIGTMSISKNCIISAVFPLKGHEKALGLDLLAHPKRKEIVQKTIETHKAFVAGPVELVEGGIAFISYTPIFETTQDTNGIFWGVTDIVIYRDRLFEEAGLKEVEAGFKYAMKGYDGSGANSDVFWGDNNIFANNPVLVNIELPYGNWQLASMPVQGWSGFFDQDKVLVYTLLISSLIISLLIFFLLKAFVRIKNNEKEFSAIFNSLDSLIMEISGEGEYLKVAPTNISLLVMTKNEIIGKRINQIFDREKTKLFMDAISECLKTKEVVIIDYPLTIGEKTSWFRARISYKAANRVIYTAFDVTKTKIAEDELKRSEESLKGLNALKDQLFSILGHDLRNPVGSFRNVAEFILDEGEQLSQTERNKLINGIKETSASLTDLIDNILLWAQSQQNTLKLNIEKQSVFDVCEMAIASQKTHALIKKIEIVNQIDPLQEAYFDVETIKIVMRNLLSNAIKFSQKGSIVYITSEVMNNEVLIRFIDQGTGILPDKIDQLFTFDKMEVTSGTNNERGSGLGLVLCKDFIELQNGKIWVESEFCKGSTFTIALPL